MTPVKNIIFDLGGVLLDIDYQKTTRAFIDLGVIDFDAMFNQFHSDELFARLETGKIPESEFFERVSRTIPGTVDAGQIETAWNAMLLDFRVDSLAFLKKAAARYQLYLLSNTNSIHLRRFQQIFTRDTGEPALDAYFRKAWYSHRIGLRKPEEEVYRFALQDAGIRAEETLFIDDSINNIEAAAGLGIQTRLLLNGEKVEELGL
ncbi:MAG: HAD family phosphatase [Chitinophagaceae bacterium]|nr:HAD family phosphatase [Chitinophagaceae bacterium]